MDVRGQGPWRQFSLRANDKLAVAESEQRRHVKTKGDNWSDNTNTESNKARDRETPETKIKEFSAVASFTPGRSRARFPAVCVCVNVCVFLCARARFCKYVGYWVCLCKGREEMIYAYIEGCAFMWALLMCIYRCVSPRKHVYVQCIPMPACLCK